MRGAALALLLFVGAVHAQSATPFGALAGQWSGAGTIELSSGREPIKCRAAYDVLEDLKNLQLNIRAPAGYNFDLRQVQRRRGHRQLRSTRNAAPFPAS